MNTPEPYDAVLGGDSRRKTKKWTEAKKTAKAAALTATDREDLYKKLNLAGYYWNAKSGEWEKIEEEAKPASELLSIRLMGDASLIAADAAQVTAALKIVGYYQLESSIEYPCRPPNQLDSRILLEVQTR